MSWQRLGWVAARGAGREKWEVLGISEGKDKVC